MARPIVQATLFLLLTLSYSHISIDGKQNAEQKLPDESLSQAIKSNKWKVDRKAGRKTIKGRKNIKPSKNKQKLDKNISKRKKKKNANKKKLNKHKNNKSKTTSEKTKENKGNRKKESRKKRKKSKKGKKTKSNRIKLSKCTNKLKKLKNINISKQACNEEEMEQKIKDYIRYSNQLRKIKRISRTCALMDNKVTKSITLFDATVNSLDKILGSENKCSDEPTKEIQTIRDQLIKCKDTVKVKCQTSSVEPCQNQVLLAQCENELQDWLPKFGSCLQESGDYCLCVTALPTVSTECLDFTDKEALVKKGKKKCTGGQEEGSFGYCKNLQLKAAEKGPGAKICSTPDTSTTSNGPGSTTVGIATSTGPGSTTDGITTSTGRGSTSASVQSEAILTTSTTEQPVTNSTTIDSEIEEATNLYIKHLDDSMEKLRNTSDIQGFFYHYRFCSVPVAIKCLRDIIHAAHLCTGSLYPLQCVENHIPLQCRKCFSNICKYVPLAWTLLPCLCSSKVKRKTTDGPRCNRDCTMIQDFRECVFDFTVRNQMSNAPGRLTDGRVRNVLTYNGQITGPSIVVCELDTVVINLKNEIQGTFEERQGQSTGTTLHMHGIRQWGQPYEDGVPGVTQCEIPSGETFQYIMNADDDHENAPPGTYWYHSHVGSQRTNGLYGALIIKPRCKRFYDIDECNNTINDDAKYTLVLQEWYHNETFNVPISILINGVGRVCETMNAIPVDVDNWDVYLDKYNKGENVSFVQVPNPDYPNFNITNYEKFDVVNGTCYRFRIIGAISQNFPLCVSIEDHKFTAIATDSIDFQPVTDVDAVCLAAGERYDIVLKTKDVTTNHPDPYMIKVYGQSNSDSPLCTLAWLKYPGQTVNPNYCIDPKCAGFKPDTSNNDNNKVLNPILARGYGKGSNDVTIGDLTSITLPNRIDWSINRNYIAFSGPPFGVKFNDISMTYNDRPFLFQSPAITGDRCGPTCNPFIWDSSNPVCILPDPPCPSGPPCQCEHVVHQPHVPGFRGEFFWFETILINPSKSVAHPIHQHGGWFRVLAIGQLPSGNTINTAKVKAMYSTISKNTNNPIQKDTIQVPTNGYVIFRTPLDNAGTWIVHCHINFHVEAGMALVFQIGGLGESPNQAWSLGPFANQLNQLSCPLNTYQNPATINWFFGMKPIVNACADKGHKITFTWVKGHNVNQLDNVNDWNRCTGVTNFTPTTGDYTWTAPQDAGTHYFACGVGLHCVNGGMKAKITVPCPATSAIKWDFGMASIQDSCADKGDKITFKWGTGHNVNQLSNVNDWNGCTGFTNFAPTSGDYTWTAPINAGTYYFACGVGSHCADGGMKAKITVPCLEDTSTIDWHLDMVPITDACADKGNKVTFKWATGHNVNILKSLNDWKGCSIHDYKPTTGDYTWTAPSNAGTYYFACGVGLHCLNRGMKAKITVPCT